MPLQLALALWLVQAASAPGPSQTQTHHKPVMSTAGRPIKPHVLFVVADDLRPTLGVYGTQALTPNVDALAARGVTFTRAFTQFPWCSPSRQSFLTGRRPDTTRAWTFVWSFRDTLGASAVPIPQHFRRQGWRTASVGKIYHGRNCVRGDEGCCPANATFARCLQVPVDADWANGNGSWDERPVDFAKVGCGRGSPNGNWCERADLNESEWCDYKVADAAVQRLEAHAGRAVAALDAGAPAQPLFLAVGFRDPHLPWAAPPRWRALFDPAKINATSRGATPGFAPAAADGVPLVAWQWPAWVGPTTPGGINISDTRWLAPADLREALRSYMASIAFTDAQLGKILAALDRLGMADDTLVLFTGDHGQNVGEHNTWCKMTAWEHSLRVPLIVAAPWLPARHGRVHAGMAEMTDFYRTLSDLAGIDPAAVDKGVEGDSLAGAVADPGLEGKPHAFSQTNRVSVASCRADVPPRGLPNLYSRLPAAADAFFDPDGFISNGDLQWMGYTVRNASWRLTEWLAWDGARLCPRAPSAAEATQAAGGDSGGGSSSGGVGIGDANGSLLVELYDHALDTTPLDLDASEYDNVAQSRPDVVAELRAVLRTKVAVCPPSPPSPPPPPTPPPLACPPGFEQHASGYWSNTDPCPSGIHPPRCRKDDANTTSVLCGVKCVATAGCAAFELYALGVPPPDRACYIFVGGLRPPFVANTHALTCVRNATGRGGRA